MFGQCLDVLRPHAGQYLVVRVPLGHLVEDPPIAVTRRAVVAWQLHLPTGDVRQRLSQLIAGFKGFQESRHVGAVRHGGHDIDAVVFGHSLQNGFLRSQPLQLV